MSTNEIKKKINEKFKWKNSNQMNEDQIWKKKQIRAWIILNWTAKLKRKINFTEELKKKS
jgi:hypothetical protein